MTKVGSTEKLNKSINNTVIIPTAGTGSRMGFYTSALNKALLPYCFKPNLAHIIDQFPSDTHFIIPVGYKADQVIDFCALAYPDRKISFVPIDDYKSEKSGPGYTVSQCLHLLDSDFYYVPCDTFFNENILDHGRDKDLVYVKQVPVELSHLYTMFDIDNDYIKQISFKQTKPQHWTALTGVMYVYDWQGFKSRCLANSSSEIIYTIQLDTKTRELKSWLDFGNMKIYQQAVSSSQAYDFTKPDEMTVICNNKVVKWWANNTMAEKKYKRLQSNFNVFPNNCAYKGNWLSYDYFPGTTVYENYNIETLRTLLTWLETTVWIHSDKNIKAEAEQFYIKKTLDRVGSFLEKYPNLEKASMVNGISVKDYNTYIRYLENDILTKDCLPGFIHGDLHFDNVIIDGKGNYKIIDWRPEFAGLTDVGDIYYDLAKLCGGFIINYSKIKQNDFTYNIVNDEVHITIPSITDYTVYLDTVKNFVIERGWNWNKVCLLIPIIFWNMAPLHTPPFDKLLWYLGLYYFELYNRNETVL